MICTRDEAGVARPMWNSETSARLLISHDTGSLTPNAPIIPCSITNVVLPQPLQYHTW